MHVNVRYFAALADHTGRREELVEVGEQDTVLDLWSALRARHPALDGLGYRPLVACDRSYATWDRSLRDVREVGFLPPLSGG